MGSGEGLLGAGGLVVYESACEGYTLFIARSEKHSSSMLFAFIRKRREAWMRDLKTRYELRND